MDSQIVTLLIEDNPGDAVLIREMLLEAPGSVFAVQWADRLSKGLDRISKGDIDIILLDLNLPDSTGLETFTKLHESAPQSPVIILSGNADEELALSAVREGAEDYLVKGKVTAEALAKNLRYTLERHAHRKRSQGLEQERRRPSARILGFLGAKGGVGTTTVALNVAAVLAKRKHDVIAVELRSSCGTLSHHFGQQLPKENLSALLELTPEQVNELELNARMGKCASGFRVLFGPQTAQQAKPVPGELAKTIIEKLARMARFVILDLPSDASESNREALRLCDFVGIVVEREPSSLICAGIMLEHMREWQVDALTGTVVVNRIPLACPLNTNEIASRLGQGVVGLIPPGADACLLAQKAGDPVVTTYADTLIADSFVELATKLAEDPIVIKKTA